MSRREFLNVASSVGGAAALSVLAGACSKAFLELPTPTSAARTTLPPSATEQPGATATLEASQTPEPTATEAPAPTEAGPAARLALVKTDRRAEGIRRAIAMLGFNPVAGKRVFLKPNFNSADPFPGSTHPDTLRALVLALQEMGASGITVGDRSGMGVTRTVMTQLGVFQMAEELGFEAISFDDLRLKDWEVMQPPSSHWAQGFAFARPCLETQALVQTCCLKTHRFGGVFTMSLKNSVGMVAGRHPTTGYEYMTELHASADQRRMIAEINLAYTPALVVLDGLEAFISGGPDKGQKAAPGVILAGVDRVAIDAVGVAILRQFGALFNGGVFEQEQIARAVELGLGVGSPEEIEFITADEPSAAFARQVKEILANG
ncbi:MAG: DUF362 domain-containing protein [Anaerolineales bacterium]|nr:DUF362 domain-containing protein [Anaerolineales bacterium]